jgi:glycosyltransferase involved in cell wall biosynthesis
MPSKEMTDILVEHARPLRVGFTIADPIERWTGGFNYLRNLISVVVGLRRDEVSPIVFCAPGLVEREGRMLYEVSGSAPIPAAWLDPAQRGRRRLGAVLSGSDACAASAFQEARIDVVFEAGQYFGWRFPIPALAWVADFQSHYYPEYFSIAARAQTAVGRHLQLTGHRLVMLSSRDSERDCHRFYPRSVGRTVVVPFAVPSPNVPALDLSLVGRHDIPARFIYLPNQFWRHKNHHLVLRALGIACKREPSLAIVASGSCHDHRNPGYFADLMKNARDLGVDRSFHVVGLVSREDVLQFALQSVAVINPSLFEGWSTTVEEAKSLGVPLLLSDLPVHQEQAGGEAIYFGRDSPEQCADALVIAWRQTQVDGMERARLAAGRAQGRTESFAADFAAAVRRARGHDG